jgi:hypothetical protein
VVAGETVQMNSMLLMNHESEFLLS